MAKEMKTYTLSQMKDKYIGRIRTKERNEYEYELHMDVMGKMIKAARQERNMTQEELGNIVGVQKAQISKLESGINSATLGTVIKVFKALEAEIRFNVRIENNYITTNNKNLRTHNEFHKKYQKLVERFRYENRLAIEGGRYGYLITGVENDFVEIKQNTSIQKQRVEHLEALFTVGWFVGPRNGVVYTRDTKWGHLGMKNAIVDYLHNL